MELASEGEGAVAPNPMVGAVIVYENEIISEGYHSQYGGPHAEVIAIHHAIENGFDNFFAATLYVNLEPCTHFGKTPPCVDLILEKGFRHVVIAQTDPNPLVSGKGIEKLKQQGVIVECDVCLEDALELNRKFNTYHLRKRPFIILKWAQSMDAFIAREDYTPVKLTNHVSDIYVHKLRAQNMSICVGGRTVISDNPQLNVRHWQGKSPVRVILDSKGRISSSASIFDNTVSTIVFNPTVTYKKNNTEFIQWNASEGLLPVMNELFSRQIQSILVEGGAQTHKRFLTENVWDEIIVFETSHMLGRGIPAPSIPKYNYSIDYLMDNRIRTLRNR